jgi:hypothetical protein
MNESKMMLAIFEKNVNAASKPSRSVEKIATGK